ncbi:MAG: hypothetical protein AB1646_25175 [Thermodesulfobacteriota bacterium]
MSVLNPPKHKSRIIESPPAPTEKPGPALSSPDPALPSAASPARKIDGRTRRSTGRTLAFATRVSQAWKEKLDRVANETGKLYCEVLEDALDALERDLKARSS